MRDDDDDAREGDGRPLDPNCVYTRDDGARATALCADGHSGDVEDEHGFTPLHNAAALAGAVGAQLATLLRARKSPRAKLQIYLYFCVGRTWLRSNPTNS